jgi:secretion/DNA translocation related TadE-like protein
VTVSPTTTGRRCDQADRGSAGILVLVLASILALVGVLAAGVGAVSVARHRAASAADLAALAAADRALQGEASACAAAHRAADEVGARVERCGLDGDVADVQVAVRPAGAVGSWGVARSHSRAGPGDR